MKMKLTNYKMPLDLIARLDAESERSGVPKSVMVRRSIERYLRELECSTMQHTSDRGRGEPSERR